MGRPNLFPSPSPSPRRLPFFQVSTARLSKEWVAISQLRVFGSLFERRHSSAMEKLTKNARYSVHADTSFALRGLISGSPVGNRTLNKVPSGIPPLANVSQLKLSPYGSRAIHRSRVLSEATRGIMSNRPLSPHLPIKKPQPSAMFSISHRIFGAGLTAFIMLVPVAYKFTVLYDI